MAIVLTNGQHYIATNKKGRIHKTQNIEEARIFYNVNTASRKLMKSSKCKGYYVYDTEGDEKPRRVKKRIHYSEDVRRDIYNKYNGKCALCGRYILYEDMTLDHIIPLSKGGADEVENLQACCYIDNQFKGNINPDDFMERITEIFLYQMNKKVGNTVKWKIVHRLLEKMI